MNKKETLFINNMANIPANNMMVRIPVALKRIANQRSLCFSGLFMHTLLINRIITRFMNDLFSCG